MICPVCARRVQMDWLHHATYSRFHPDNLHKPQNQLPESVKAPPAVVSFTKNDKLVRKAWGHTNCCERPYGPSETTTRIKDAVTAKIGSTWIATQHFEKGDSTSQSAMYGGSCKHALSLEGCSPCAPDDCALTGSRVASLVRRQGAHL